MSAASRVKRQVRRLAREVPKARARRIESGRCQEWRAWAFEMNVRRLGLAAMHRRYTTPAIGGRWHLFGPKLSPTIAGEAMADGLARGIVQAFEPIAISIDDPGGPMAEFAEMIERVNRKIILALLGACLITNRAPR